VTVREELHELVALTAIILRRGLVVGVTAATAWFFISIVTAALSVFVCGILLGQGFTALVAAMGAIVVPWPAFTALVAAFTCALDREPTFDQVMREAMARAPRVFSLIIFGAVPVPLAVVGVWIVVACFGQEAVAAVVGSCVLGALFILGAVWIFARWFLILSVATFLNPVSNRTYDLHLHDHGTLVLAVGTAPLVAVVAILGHSLSPVVSAPLWLEATVALAGIAATLVVSVAMATAAYAIAWRGSLVGSPVMGPPMTPADPAA
jgi:hypothetical protein